MPPYHRRKRGIVTVLFQTLCPGCRRVVSILAGMEAALVESTESWTELLVAHLLHAYPGLRPQVELRSLVRRCRQLCKQQEEPVSDPPPSPAHALPHIMTVRSGASWHSGNQMPSEGTDNITSCLCCLSEFSNRELIHHLNFTTGICSSGMNPTQYRFRDSNFDQKTRKASMQDILLHVFIGVINACCS